jgi:hypothetical protein
VVVSTFVLTLMVAQHRELRLGPPFSKDAAVRLAYMKDSVTPYRIHRTAAGSPPFRLIADPIFRLDNPVSQVKDSAIFLWTDPATGRPGVEEGALFAFAIGTDPEVFLMIESRPNPAGGFRWEYALAPMTSFEVKVSWKGNDVWTLPRRKDSFDPNEPFYDMYYSQEP